MREFNLVASVVANSIMLVGLGQYVCAQESKTSPGYIVAEQEILDAEAAKKFAACVGPTLSPFHAKVLVRGGKTDAIQGDPPKRIVIFAFESAVVARNWINSAAHKACQPLQEKAMHERVYIVEGLGQR